MNPVKVSIDINSPAPLVYQTLCDVERWPEWSPTMQSVKRLDTGAFAVGSKARVVQPKLRPADWQVSSLAPDRNFTWVTRSPGLQMEAGHAVETTGAGCRVTLTFAMSGLLSPVAGLLYRKLIAEYVTTEAQSLKRHCEK